MLNALSTALFALTLRLASEAIDAPVGLLALAGHSRLAPAFAALFREPARSWSLPELARLCNMSRATLVRQFQEKLGRSASDLLTDIRMTLAANKFKEPVNVHRRCCGCGGLSIRGSIPARIQELHGCYSGPVAENEGTTRRKRKARIAH